MKLHRSASSCRVLAVALAIAAVALVGAGRAGNALLADEPSALARGPGALSYHLRVVRVTGVSAPRGAGLGCTGRCGTPILLPSEEAWGTPEQTAALARVLGGERADAVTGFAINADGMTASFAGRIYPGETFVDLRFEAVAPQKSGDPHDITLLIHRPDETAPPLAEAHILARADRTVAIATPSPIEGEWIVLAVTPMDSDAARQQVEREQDIYLLGQIPGITPPERVRAVDPVYPGTAREEKRSGVVLLESLIDAEGIPRAIRVLRVPPGCEDMASAAVEAVRQWRYEPARLEGRPVPVYFTIMVDFALE